MFVWASTLDLCASYLLFYLFIFLFYLSICLFSRMVSVVPDSDHENKNKAAQHLAAASNLLGFTGRRSLVALDFTASRLVFTFIEKRASESEFVNRTL